MRTSPPHLVPLSPGEGNKRCSRLQRVRGETSGLVAEQSPFDSAGAWRREVPLLQ